MLTSSTKSIDISIGADSSLSVVLVAAVVVLVVSNHYSSLNIMRFSHILSAFFALVLALAVASSVYGRLSEARPAKKGRVGTAAGVDGPSSPHDDADKALRKPSDASEQSGAATASSTDSAAPAISSYAAASAPSFDINYMLAPVYIWGNSFLSKVLFVEDDQPILGSVVTGCLCAAMYALVTKYLALVEVMREQTLRSEPARRSAHQLLPKSVMAVQYIRSDCRSAARIKPTITRL
ncbi:hypothetical protein K488DRAFT_90633 [Vararia minispora EC-137]|uniref:Uncharacterized protein n=1 Tax=Vararia minispora EC-137 TaxID=1314806 RepID=A0ACB8Q7H4_9AGAM|nr:hypothetical protein K488DRAFT_90633 [Vararia minispora EC-137]